MNKERLHKILITLCAVTAVIAIIAEIVWNNRTITSGAAGSEIPADAVTCEGTAPGMVGDVTVEVVATADKIYKITVTQQEETKDIGTKAVEILPQRIYEAQSLQVDNVSGATVTSKAIKEAINNALANGRVPNTAFYDESLNTEEDEENGENAEPKAAGADDSEIPADAITCEGTAPGMEGDVTVQVVATADKIYKITVTEQEETQGIGTVACEKIPQKIYEAQSVQVDGISGATITSDAIKEAVNSALANGRIPPANFNKEAAAAPVAKGEDKTYDTDVVVVGAGGAGMIAAIEAGDNDADVIILESMAMAGGNSARAEGGMNAAHTKWQDENTFDEAKGVEKTLKNAESDEFKDNETVHELAAVVKEQWDAYQANPEGYFDTPELFQLDLLIGGHGTNDPELIKTLTENSAAAIDWLDTINIHLNNVSSAGGAAVKRIHRPVDEDGKFLKVGAYMVPLLEENLEDRNIEILYETTADKILTDADGAAVGVEATAADGSKVTVNAKAVVITTGGFGANHEMVEEYRPELKGFMTTNAPGAQGQGIKMAQDVGAAVVDMDQIQIHPTVQVDSSSLITEGLRGDGAILINQEGDRFYDEVSTRDKVSAAELAQTGSQVWLIVDNKMAEASTLIEGYINKGYTVTGNTYEELADAMGVDPEEFAKTMDTWNGYAEKKEDPDFGRTSFGEPLDTAPFYAIHVSPGIHHTMGGIKINSATEVEKEDGSVIPGLYAAGEVTGGVHGGNRLGGTAVSDFTVFGRIAGTNASEYVKTK